MFKQLIYLVSFILVLGLVQTSIAQDADPNLAGWWKFDGDANDASGNGRHGTLLGDVQFEAGVFDQAVVLDGGVDIIGYKGIVADHTDPNNPFQRAFSITAWIKTSGNGTIMGWGSTAGGRTRVEFRINANRLRCESQGNIQGDTTLPDNEWFHAAVTITEGAIIDDPNVTLYLNGQDDTRTSTGGSNPLDVAAGYDVTIGRRHTSGRVLVGSIDEVRLYDKVLTPEEVQLLATRYKAYRPDPNDGDVVNETWASLGWTPGDTAVSHDVYFGDNFDNVNDGTGGTFVGNQATTMLIVGLGMPGDPLPTGFTPGTTYYWRIDEVEADGTTVHKGLVWSFYVPPHTAYEPYPPDGATNVITDVLLTWMPGLKVMSHDVYFGTNLADVTDGTVPTASGTDPNYLPGPLANDTTYYWRVDENDGVATYKGAVLSFTTLPEVALTVEPNLVALWTLDEGAGSASAVDWSGNGHHGVLMGDPQWLAVGHDGGALEFDGSDDYVNVNGWKGIVADRTTDPANPSQRPFSIACWINTTKEDAGSLVCWGSSDGTGVGGQYQNFRVEGGRLRAEHGNGRFRGAARFADGEWHHVAMTVAEGVNLEPPGTQLYVDGRKDTQGDDTVNSQNIWNITADADVSIGRRPSHDDRYFTGLLDDVYIYDRVLSEAEIVDMAAGLSAQAARPFDGSTLTDPRPILSWLSGTNTAAENGHELYISADVNAVTDRTADKVVLSEPNYAITTSLGAGTYYWAVDQVEADGVTIHAGPVWSFTVIAVITVGPIESLDAIANPMDPNMLLAPLAINGIDVSGLVLGTTTADFEKYPDNPAANADNFGLTTYASLDDATLVKTVFDVPVTTIFILEMGADDSGFFQPIDANDIPIGAPLAFTAADFHFAGTDTLKIAGQPAGGIAIVADVPINGLEITPPIDGPLGIDPAIIAAIPVPAE